MKLLKKLSFALLFSLTLSACSLGKGAYQDMAKPADAGTEAVVSMSPTPTLSQDNSFDSIEADLKATTILEEDFSDLD